MSELEASSGDDVLRWSSENGAGRWATLNEAVGHAMAARGGSHLRPWQLAGNLSALGHLDIDWEDGRWSTSPPCLVLPRDLGLCAYLAGWRTTRLLERFEKATYTKDVYSFSIEQGSAPKAVYAKCGSVKCVEEIAIRLGVPVVYDPASQLVDLVSLPPEQHLLASPPPKDETLHRFDPANLQWIRVETRDQPGLYHFELHGRKVFRIQSDDWYLVDRAIGQLRVLAGRQDLLRWHPASADMTTPRVLRVHAGLSLPALAERALVSASGLLPAPLNGWRVYRNVSPAVAALLAEALGLGAVQEPLPIPTWRT